MKTRFIRPAVRLLLGAFAALLSATAAHAASPSAEQALRMVPSQDGVDYDRPRPEDIAKCKITAKKIEGHVGWIVESPEGLLLRKFVDTDGDNIVDQWCYYKDGIEVYREFTTRSGTKANEFRWLNTAGTRWGADSNGGGKLTAWKSISAEEATAEIVAALANRDAERFNRVLLTADELSSLGLGKARSDAMAAKIAKASAEFRALADRQRSLSAESKWVQFSGGRPGIVPAGTDDSTQDVEAYDNVVAIAQTGEKNVQVQIGTLVHVGKTWKAVDLPTFSVEGQPEVASHGLITPGAPATPNVGGVGPADEKLKALIEDLEKTDPNSPQRVEKLQRIIDYVKTSEERSVWLRQMADLLSAGVQTGRIPDGEKRLEELLAKAQQAGDQNLAAYIKIRLLTAAYAKSISEKGADFNKIQAKWTKDLEQFISDYPKSPDAAEAMLQLGIAREYAGQDDEAKKWYVRIGGEFADAPQAKKAAGAARRLALVGSSLSLSGRGLNGQTIDLANYHGKVVLVQFWSTWSQAAKTDMAVIKQLVGKYHNFTVIGVSLDGSEKDVKAYLAENPLPWEQIYEEGGQDSRPANALGIITVPTMILVDAEGKVLNRNIQSSELDAELKKLAP